MRILSFVLLSFLLLSATLHAAGTVTVTTTNLGGPLVKHSAAWTSTNGGAVSGNAFTVTGRLLQVKITPGTGGAAPTDDYDLTLVDSDGVDLLNGGGANLDATTGVYILTSPGVILDGSTLDIVIANAGDTNGGTVEIWATIEPWR